jgi:hypothetical protein
MGEAKNREAEIAGIKAKAAEEMKARFEEQQRLKAAEEEFRKRLETPMTEDEARRALAEVGLREAQLNLARHSIMGQLSQIDSELASVQMKRAEIAYRITVPVKPVDEEKPADEGNPPDGSPADGGQE